MKFQFAISMNKVLLEHSHAIRVHIVCGFFHPATAELSSCNRELIASKPKMLAICLLTEKVGRPLFWMRYILPE